MAFCSYCRISAWHFAAPTLFLHRVLQQLLFLHGISQHPLYFCMTFCSHPGVVLLLHEILELLSDFCMAFHSNCYFCMGFCSHTGIALFLHGVFQLLHCYSMGFCSCILISAWGFGTDILFLHGIMPPPGHCAIATWDFLIRYPIFFCGTLQQLFYFCLGFCSYPGIALFLLGVLQPLRYSAWDFGAASSF